VFAEAQRRWTLRTDDDLVLRLNDVTMVEDNRAADAYPPSLINSPPSRAPGER
jgi:cell division septal protein FtsQ